MKSFTFTFKQEHITKFLSKNSEAKSWYLALSTVLPLYEITTPNRVAAFLAQTSHESAGYTVLKENLNYRAETLCKVFPKHFPTQSLAETYAKKPALIANKVYGNRMGNGGESTGDGFKFCGRGLIQLTGKDNYTLFAKSIDKPLDLMPEYLTTKEGALKSACWFWTSMNLNSIADKGDMVMLTRRINGGTHGLEDRIQQYNRALELLKT